MLTTVDTAMGIYRGITVGALGAFAHKRAVLQM